MGTVRDRAGSVLRGVLHLRGMATFMFAALVVGVLVGLALSLLIWAISEVGDTVAAGQSSLELWTALLVIPAGLLISWVIARRWGPGITGGGVTPTMVGLSLRSGYLPGRTIGAKLAATVATIGTGGSAGREGPAVQIGATIGSVLARYTNFGEDQIRSLVAAGAGAGIAASFNAPIAGMLFAVEVILGNFAIRHLNAVVVACVAAAVTARSIVGEDRILSGPPHELTDPRQLVLYALLGLLAVGASAFFLRALDRADREPRRMPWLRPVIAGLIVAGIGIAEPRLLGTGQEFVGELIRDGAGELWWILLLLGAGKVVGAVFTTMWGGSGGEFMPALFIGASLGAGLAILLEPLWGFSRLDPGAFAVVGMAAVFAGIAHAPLTAVIMVFEITGDYGLVLPLMLAATLATVGTVRLSPDSAYTLPLRRRGIHLPKSEDIDLLDTVTVGDVMTTEITTVTPALTTAEIDTLLERERHHGLPVVVDGRLAGLITLKDIQADGGPSPTRATADVMIRRPITVTPSMPVSQALARMASLGIGRMPVVADDDPGRYLGMFRRASVISAYHHALGSSRGRHLYRERLQQRIDPGTGFSEIPVPRGSPVDGVRIRDLELPAEAILVSVRRGPAVLIPHGDTAILTGDTVTLFGTPESHQILARTIEPHRTDTEPGPPSSR